MLGLYVFAKLAGAFDYSKDTEGLEDVDTQELFRQINHHAKIDGYRVFAERQTGNCYTVTFLSKNSRRCVLAEITDIADSQGVIKIIAF